LDFDLHYSIPGFNWRPSIDIFTCLQKHFLFSFLTCERFHSVSWLVVTIHHCTLQVADLSIAQGLRTCWNITSRQWGQLTWCLHQWDDLIFSILVSHSLWSSDFYCQALSSFILGVFPLFWSGPGLDSLVWIRFFYLTFYSTSHICCMCVCVVVWLSPQSLGCGLDRRPWKVKGLNIHFQCRHFLWRQIWSCILFIFFCQVSFSANLLSRQQQIEAAYNIWTTNCEKVYTLSR